MSETKGLKKELKTEMELEKKKITTIDRSRQQHVEKTVQKQ